MIQILATAVSWILIVGSILIYAGTFWVAFAKPHKPDYWQ